MSIIVPYYENLEKLDGIFFDKSGNMVGSIGIHEAFAMDYCHGSGYDSLDRLKNVYSKEIFEEWKQDKNFEGEQSDIDVFSTTNLTKEQLKAFKRFMEEEQFDRLNCTSFIAQFCSFDIVRRLRKTIVTTDSHPYDRLWNYYLMDWDIDVVKMLYFNEVTGEFRWQDRGALYLEENYETKYILDEIKQKTRLEDRKRYFKQ